MSYYRVSRSSGLSLPTGSKRVVYWFRLDGMRTLSTRLLLLPTGLDLAGYCGYSPREPLYWAFNPAHLQARAGLGKRLLAELRLSRDLCDLESIACVAFELADFCERNYHGTQEQCARFAGHLGAIILEELAGWGVPVATARLSAKYVQRAEEADGVVFRFWLKKKEHAVRLLLVAEGADDGATVDEPFTLSAYPRLPGDVRVSRSAVGFDAIVERVYSLISPLRRKGRVDDFTGAYLCGELVAGICQELERLGIPVARHVDPPALCRVRDKWKLLPG